VAKRRVKQPTLETFVVKVKRKRSKVLVDVPSMNAGGDSEAIALANRRDPADDDRLLKVERHGWHLESCIDLDEITTEGEPEIGAHFGDPHITSDGSHTCGCLCHGVYLEFEKKIEGAVKEEDESWRQVNR